MAGEFSRKVRAFANGVPVQANTVKQAYATAVLKGIVAGTPVKTGKARSNWNVGIGAPDYSIRPSEGATGAATIQRGQVVINAANPGQALHISNGLPYIARLNSGWSKQAPTGYIERAVAAARAAIKSIRLAEVDRGDRKL